MLSEAALASFAAALFSMMNPIGSLGVFSGLTEGRSDAEVRRIALTCAVAVAITLLSVTWAGSLFFGFFGVSVDSLRAAGGVIVLLIGLRMLSNDDSHKHSKDELEDSTSRTSIAVVPLAIPIIAGPGSMIAVFVATNQGPALISRLEISAVVVILSVFTGVLFLFAPTLSRLIGAAGMGVVTRIMGMVLAAIAMGMLAEGLKNLLPGLAGGT